MLDKSHKTAKTRVTASRPLQNWMPQLIAGSHVLDYGCGRGQDVKCLTDAGFQASGYDPTYAPVYPSTQFDAVLCTYVLNVIEDEADLQTALRNMSELAPVTYFAVRSGKDFNPNWEPRGDGYLTWAGTFQRGFSPRTLEELVNPYWEEVKCWQHGNTTYARCCHTEPNVVEK